MNFYTSYEKAFGDVGIENQLVSYNFNVIDHI